MSANSQDQYNELILTGHSLQHYNQMQCKKKPKVDNRRTSQDLCYISNEISKRSPEIQLMSLISLVEIHSMVITSRVSKLNLVNILLI